MEIKRVRSKVVMLPTENKSDIVLHESNRLGYLPELSRNVDWEFVEKDWTPQYLHFTTEEKIKKGDWYIDDCNLVRKSVTSDKDYWDRRPDYKKIVSSTDTSLGLPQPTTAFIKKYVELGGIDEVDLEYGEFRAMLGLDIDDNTKINYSDPWYELKVDSHNTITIHAIKNSWSREEVEIELRTMHINIHGAGAVNMGLVEDWIKENL